MPATSHWQGLGIIITVHHHLVQHSSSHLQAHGVDKVCLIPACCEKEAITHNVERKIQKRGQYKGTHTKNSNNRSSSIRKILNHLTLHPDPRWLYTQTTAWLIENRPGLPYATHPLAHWSEKAELKFATLFTAPPSRLGGGGMPQKNRNFGPPVASTLQQEGQ